MRGTPAELAFARHNAAALVARASREPAWLGRHRAESFDAFQAQGLPAAKHEDWRFTSLAKLERIEFESGGADADTAPAASRIALEDAHRLVLVNGRYAASLSSVGALPAGCRVAPLSAVLAASPGAVERVLASAADPKRGAFVALNSALWSDGAFVELEPGATLDRPLHVLFLQSGASAPVASHVRTLVAAGERSRGLIVEQHAGDTRNTDLTNAVTEIRVGRGAQLDHVLLQDLPVQSFGFSAVFSRQDEQSRLGLHTIALGAALARAEVESRLEGEGAELALFGLYLGRGAQHPDHHTTIDHAAPRTTSVELFKGILDERAHGVFHGRIHVRPDAQKISADQTNRALLLSDRATINSKPQLEIYADDVKCSHGASIGQLDDEQLFYLRARGLDRAAARALLTVAFASEVLEKLPHEALRESLERALLGWLPGGGGA
ncbi:MAG: Fe-S cluster assembly protein SufD [Myxococcota bacterium]